VSDHTPYKVQIQTQITKAALFHFENYLTQNLGFMDIVASACFSCSNPNAVVSIFAKFKATRKALKVWEGKRSKLTIVAAHCNMVIRFLDDLEDLRTLLSSEEGSGISSRISYRGFCICNKSIGNRGTQKSW